MHRTYPVSRPSCWGPALALVFCIAVGVGRAAAQPAGPTRGVVVPVNVTKVHTLSGKNLITRIQVENPAVVRANPSSDARSVLLTGLTPGRTMVTITDKEGAAETLEVVVQSDVEYLRFMLRRAVPTANVEPIPSANNTFILTGTVAKAEDVPIIMKTAESVVGAAVVNALRVGGVQQVHVDVTIAEVSRSEVRNLGFSFYEAGQNHFVTNVLTSPNSATATNTPSPSSLTALLTSQPNGAFGIVNSQQGFLGFLIALRTEGLAKFHSEPGVTVVSGKSAYFQSGGKLAVPQPSGLGTNAVDFVPFGTQLTVLPIVLGNGKIWLEVEPIVDTINANNGTTIAGTTVPGFDTQRLHTSVELEPGQTYAIGGLIQHTTNAAAQKVPLLGDIPFLNTIFSTKNDTEVETELLILITPHLVDAMACNQVPKYLPGDETRIADDFELFLEGILEAPRGSREVFPGGHYRAAYLNGPSASVFPCAGGACGASYGQGCGSGCGSCANGSCGRPMAGTTPGYTPAGGVGPAMEMGPSSATLPAITTGQSQMNPVQEVPVSPAPGN